MKRGLFYFCTILATIIATFIVTMVIGIDRPNISVKAKKVVLSERVEKTRNLEIFCVTKYVADTTYYDTIRISESSKTLP